MTVKVPASLKNMYAIFLSVDWKHERFFWYFSVEKKHALFWEN